MVRHLLCLLAGRQRSPATTAEFTPTPRLALSPGRQSSVRRLRTPGSPFRLGATTGSAPKRALGRPERPPASIPEVASVATVVISLARSYESDLVL